MSRVARERLTVGIGCTRGAPAAVLASAIDLVLARHGLTHAAVHTLASIDTKRDELALQTLASERGWRLTFHAAASLAAVSRSVSACVQQAVGAPAVAEPAALLAAPGSTLLIPKIIHRDEASGHSVTIAVARFSEQP